MSEPEILPSDRDGKQPSRPGSQLDQGPSLNLLYGLVVLALAAAIGFALLIVLPFYQRR